MNGYGFVASVIQSLASLGWPIAAVVCIWLFRDKLTELLPLLHVKHKDWEASFRLAEGEKDAKALPPNADIPPPTPEEVNRFEMIAKVSPRAAILESRAELENALYEFANAVGAKTERSLLSTVRNLRNNGLIDAHTSAIIDDLRAIGNNAAHRADTNFTFDDAQRVRELTERVVQQLEFHAAAVQMASRPSPLSGNDFD